MTGRGHAGQDPFPDAVARRGFLSLVAERVREQGWEALAYCLLSTHYHLLVRTGAPNLGAGMRVLHGRHAQLLNARLARTGPVWGDRLHSRVVRSGLHVIHAAVYIDVNPVAAGLCLDAHAWPWSSFRANAGLAEPPGWHRVDVLHGYLGAGPDEATRLYHGLVEGAVERLHARRARGHDHGGQSPPGTDPTITPRPGD